MDKLPPGASYTCRAGGDADDGDEPMAGPSKPRQPDSSSSSSSEDYNSSNNESDRERNRTVKNIVQQLARKRPLLDEDEDEDEDDDEKMRIRMRSRLRRSGPVRRQTRTSWLG